MFTGIITDIGIIKDIQPEGDALRAVITTHLDASGWALGGSVACSGVCLTIIARAKHEFTVQISQETLRCTNLSAWKQGTRLNLEPALKLGDELGGHIVSGHVDGVGEVKIFREQSAEGGEHWELQIIAPDILLPFIPRKGSIAVDGVSLTVNKVEGDSFSVNLIPHTLAHTTLHRLKEGDTVNLEIDMLARYVQRMMECKA